VANGSLTALQLDAAAGLLQNQGIGISANLTQAITQYQDTALISPFLNTIQVGSANVLSANVITDLETLAANTCSAFSNSIPPAYSSLGVQMTDVVLAQATVDICDNNVSKLTQAVNQAQGYAEQTSIFINSAVNSQTYLGNTFTSINNMITGSIGTINLVTTAFGSDLQNLGQLINLRNLDNFGTPLALVQQLFSVAGTVPILSVAFVNAGIAEEVVLNLTNPTVAITDSIQRAMYQALTQITGSDLSQLLRVLGVTTVGLKTAADLLNPLKLFPNSFQSLTTPTANGPVAVYVDSTGSINTQLTQLLPPYVVSSLV
jgi:type III secretory pathway component EscS